MRGILEKRRRNLLHPIDRFKKFEEFFITIQEDKHEKIGPMIFNQSENVGFTKDEFVAFIEERVLIRNLFYSIPTQSSYGFMGKQLGGPRIKKLGESMVRIREFIKISSLIVWITSWTLG